MIFNKFRRKSRSKPNAQSGNQTPEDLLAKVTSALADQQSRHADLGQRLKVLESRRDRLEREDASDQDLALIYSEIEEVENLRSVLTARIGNLRTNRTALQTSIQLNSGLNSDQLTSIQMEYERAQQSFDATREYTDLMRDTGEEIRKESERDINEMLERGRRRRGGERSEATDQVQATRRRRKISETEE